jgi:hypothetical protein
VGKECLGVFDDSSWEKESTSVKLDEILAALFGCSLVLVKFGQREFTFTLIPPSVRSSVLFF